MVVMEAIKNQESELRRVQAADHGSFLQYKRFWFFLYNKSLIKECVY